MCEILRIFTLNNIFKKKPRTFDALTVFFLYVVFEACRRVERAIEIIFGLLLKNDFRAAAVCNEIINFHFSFAFIDFFINCSAITGAQGDQHTIKPPYIRTNYSHKPQTV